MERACIHNSAITCSDGRCTVKCGWNPRGIAARKKQIEGKGLTEREDGIRRLVIKKGAGNAR